MQLQPVIRFQGFTPIVELEQEIRRRLAALRTYGPSITACRVLLRLANRHQQLGNRFEVRLDLSVPGGRHLLVSHVANPRAVARREAKAHLRKSDELHAGRRYAMVAVRDTFAVARRRLQDAARKRRER